jgi:hypothetical protein
LQTEGGGSKGGVMMAGPVLAVLLVGGLVMFGWTQRRAASGDPIRLPTLPALDLPLPLRGAKVLVGEALIIAVSILIIALDLVLIGLLR